MVGTPTQRALANEPDNGDAEEIHDKRDEDADGPAHQVLRGLLGLLLRLLQQLAHRVVVVDVLLQLRGEQLEVILAHMRGFRKRQPKFLC